MSDLVLLRPQIGGYFDELWEGELKGVEKFKQSLSCPTEIGRGIESKDSTPVNSNPQSSHSKAT